MSQNEKNIDPQEKPGTPAPYSPTKLLGEMDGVERQNYYAEERAREQAEQEARTEELRKGRIRRAFLESGGDEADFEETYPQLRRRVILAETMKKATATDPVAGALNSDGSVRW
jgi:hypothetical protein